MCYVSTYDLQGLVNNSEWFQQSLKSTSYATVNCIRQLLSKFLDKKYPTLDQITVPELLEWVMWPSFLGMVGNIEVREYQHNIAITTALSMLESLSDTISKRTITWESFTYINGKRRQLKKLCDAVNSCKKQICNCLQYFDLEKHLDDCCKLQNTYSDYRERISTLLEFCDTISHGTYVCNQLYSYM